MYRRYHIDTSFCAPQSPVVPKFTVKVDRLKFVRMIFRELMTCSSVEEMKATVKSRPCLYGVYNRPVGGLAPKSNLCVSCYRCVLENPEIVHILPNPDFQEVGAPFMTPKQVSTVWYEATTGRVPVRGAGYNGPFSGSGFDGMWTDMSEIVRPTRDGIHGREYISTAVTLGSKLPKLSFDERGKAQDDPAWSVRVSIPILFDSIPIGPQHLHAAIAAAAEETQSLAFVHGLENIPPPLAASVVPVLSVQELLNSRPDLSVYPAVEVECSTVEEFRTAKKKKDGLFVRVNARKGVEGFIRELVDEGASVVHLCADWTGREEGTRFITDILRAVHMHLVKENRRDQVSLIASGGIVGAEHVPKAIICGADAVALNVPLVVAMQGEALMADGASLSIRLPRFDQAWARRRIVNLVGSWHIQLLEILGAMGLREVRRLRGEVGRAMFAEDLEKEFCETICGSNRE